MNLFPKYFFENIINIPNTLSFFRLLLSIPAFYFLQNLNTSPINRKLILVIIIIAYISDFLDGYIARKKNCITEFGKIIDPLADKLFIIIIAIQLYLQNEIVSIYFWIIFLRDLIIFLGGIYVSKKIGKVLPSNMLGKITVLTIGIFLFLTILGVNKIFWLYKVFFYLSTALSILSVIGYSLRAYETIKQVSK
ncbi:CDP-alcohol phosphatidyltransferase family protein [Ignavibacteria bacterium 4148-Me]|uniref:CDP-alcohol phosphatidyltransferase family protein n=1 Tax=Rosettibacter primus TaxID=3111523 RepID=UPI00336BC7ED